MKEIKTTENFKGIPSSPGIAIGKAVVFQAETVISPIERIEPDNIATEIDRFEAALQDMILEFDNILDMVKDESGNVSAIIDASLLIAKDPVLRESVINRIKKCFTVESSVLQEFEEQKEFFKKSPDKILRERAIELDNIKERLIATLRNKCIFYGAAKDSIVVAQNITPTDFLKFKEAGVKGVITEVGGISSHTSILARSMEIPSVIGVKNATELIETDSELILDGYEGRIKAWPSKDDYSKYLLRKEKEIAYKKKLGEVLELPSETMDGRKVKLLTNIDYLDDVKSSHMLGAEGIGLVRTEHLIMKYKEFPEEQVQYKWYRELAQRSYPNPVTLRIFDIGSDKHAEGLPHHEDNPALGYRGMRLMLSRKDLYETQLRAILKASQEKNIKIMLPMISSVEELYKSLSVIAKIKRNFIKDDIPFDHNIPIGIMIETPAAVLEADRLAEFADFFSIGTNDLTQYVLASDRTNDLVSQYFDYFHPALIKMIKMAIDSAKRNNIPVSICGELAGHAAATSLLVGLGIDELSVSPSILPELKARIRSINYSDAKKLADEILEMYIIDDIRQRLYSS